MPSRREFLKDLMTTGAGLYTPATVFAALLQDKKHPQSTVVEVKNASVQGEGRRLRPEIVQAMVFEVVRRLSGEKTDKNAWKHFFKPEDVVGIKVN